MKFGRSICAALLSTLGSSLASTQEAIPTPVWKPGSISYYSVHLKTSRDIKAKSALALPATPNETKIDVSGILQVEILPAEPAASLVAAHLRTHFLYLVSDIAALQRGKKPDQSGEENAPADDKTVECVLQSDGQITQIAGLDQLASEQREAWREWAAHFSYAYLIETEAHKRGSKWNSEQPETSPAPIAELVWQKKSRYVHDEPCAPVKFDSAYQRQRGPKSENCGVILTTASLIQKSSEQDATPRDYKLRGLRTRGTAKGTNETILYICRRTGQLILATQDAKQQMDVQIALSDGTNQVHYAVTASANSTVELVTELPFNPRANP